MKKKVDNILKEVLCKVSPPKEDLDIVNNYLKKFLDDFGKKLKRYKIDAEIFIGGSFAKKTVIKKDCYDIDVFLRFDKKYDNEELSKITEKMLKGVTNISVIHGSRDYFKIKIGPNFFMEIIPVKKIKNQKEAENITDLSYSHVKYINKKIKSKKILEEIMLAKAFCYANNCYGAESYINGFSGYALELLVYHYKGFMNFIKAVAGIKDKSIIDTEKHYKNKAMILMDINSAKLSSPIILIDPTYKQRNALAALSDETFEKFKKDCKNFLKNPSIKAFEVKKNDLEIVKKNAKKKKFEFILLEAKTNKQVGDVAGSKLLKFYRHLNDEIGRFFDIKNKGFEYDDKKSAKYFFVVKPKKDILIQGPNINDVKNIKRFKKEHKKTFAKKGRIYCKEKVEFSIEKFIKTWLKKNNKRLKEMYISGLRVV